MQVDHEEIIDRLIFKNPDNALDGSIQEYRDDILLCTMNATVDTLTVILDNATLTQSDRLTILNMRTNTLNNITKKTNRIKIF